MAPLTSGRVTIASSAIYSAKVFDLLFKTFCDNMKLTVSGINVID